MRARGTARQKLIHNPGRRVDLLHWRGQRGTNPDDLAPGDESRTPLTAVLAAPQTEAHHWPKRAGIAPAWPWPGVWRLGRVFFGPEPEAPGRKGILAGRKCAWLSPNTEPCPN
jgi:hypothetical protein